MSVSENFTVRSPSIVNSGKRSAKAARPSSDSGLRSSISKSYGGECSGPPERQTLEHGAAAASANDDRDVVLSRPADVVGVRVDLDRHHGDSQCAQRHAQAQPDLPETARFNLPLA